MNDGVKQGLRIAVAAVLAIALVLAAMVAWMDSTARAGQRRIEAEVSSFCESVPLGADRAALLRQAAARGIALWPSADGLTFRYRRQMAAYNEISCELTLDAAGKVAAHTFHPYGGIGLHRPASAAASR